MRNPQGYATLTDPQGPPKEWDTFTCGHCSRIVHVPPRADAVDCGGLCKVCMRLVCRPCTAQGNCTPWERRLERMEARERALRSYGI